MQMHTEMVEAMLAAVVLKLADGELELNVDDLLAVEGKVFMVNDCDDGFVLTVTDGEEVTDGRP